MQIQSCLGIHYVLLLLTIPDRVKFIILIGGIEWILNSFKNKEICFAPQITSIAKRVAGNNFTMSCYLPAWFDALLKVSY